MSREIINYPKFILKKDVSYYWELINEKGFYEIRNYFGKGYKGTYVYENFHDELGKLREHLLFSESPPIIETKFKELKNYLKTKIC